MKFQFFNKTHNWEEALKEPEKVKRLDVRFHEFDLNDYSHIFQKMKNLESIFLQTSVYIYPTIPEIIGELVKLKKLYILNYEYTEFPTWIFKLKNLRKLMVRGHDIKHIPNEISKLQKLKSIRLENCSLETLPKSMSEMQNLTKISLRDNFKLKTIESDYLPPNLKILSTTPSTLSEENKSVIKACYPKLKWDKWIE
ncbi:MAG: hypothetical protein ACI85I_000388 [Arenicella sp.]|jgi:hypothetical protein